MPYSCMSKSISSPFWIPQEIILKKIIKHEENLLLKLSENIQQSFVFYQYN